MVISETYEEIEPPRAAIDAMPGGVVVEFGAPWCSYCRAAQSLIASSLGAHPTIRHIKIEDGPGRALGRSFRIKLWPTLILLRDGQEIARLVRPTHLNTIADAFAQLTE